MQGIGAAAVIGLGILSFYHPEVGSWIYIVLFVVLFQGALLGYMNAAGRKPLPAGEAPYNFSAQEADFVRRHRFAFKYPTAAQAVSSMLAAMGLTALVLSPWLAYKLEWTQAMLIGLDIFLIGHITRRLNPKYTLVLAAHGGNERAARDIETFNGAWRKILAAKGIQPGEIQPGIAGQRSVDLSRKP